jgi:putative tryptophan/tyrosine transport system substrate-binding protein
MNTIKNFSLLLVIALLWVGCKSNNPKSKTDLNSPQTYKVKIITYKSHTVLDEIVQNTLTNLIDLGGIPKENIEVFNPNGKLEEIQTFVRNLNSHTTSLIISVATPSTMTVITSRHPSIPVLYSFVSDPRALNLDSAYYMHSNITGISNVLDYEKGFQLLRKIMPGIKTLGVIYNPSESNSMFSFNQIQSEAQRSTPPISIIRRQFSSPNEIQPIASTIQKVDAIYVGGDNTLVQNINLLLGVANNRRIPIFASDEGSVRAGAIAAYSINYAEFGRETARLALEILKQGTSNGIIPVNYKKGRVLINRTSLDQMKIPIPQDSTYVEVK